MIEFLNSLAGFDLRYVWVVKLVDDDGGVEDSICALLEDEGDVGLCAEDVAQVH